MWAKTTINVQKRALFSLENISALDNENKKKIQANKSLKCALKIIHFSHNPSRSK